MTDPAYAFLLRHDADRVHVALRGTLEGASLPDLGAAVDAQLDAVPTGTRVVVDLTEVSRCDRAACRALARIQRRFKAHQCRTAWLADRPRLRGAAWWIVHAAKDPQAMPVTSQRFADEWLTGDEERLDQVGSRMHEAFGRAQQALSRRRAR